MLRSFLMVCDGDFWEVPEVAEWADRSSLVLHWRYDMPGCLYLLSEAKALDLSKDFQQAAVGRGPFIVCEVNEEIAGVMLPETWAVLHDKNPTGVTLNTDKVPVEAEKAVASRPAPARS